MTKSKKIYLYFILFMVIYIEFSYQMVVANQIPGFARMMILLILAISIFIFRQRIQLISLFCLITIIIYVSVNSLRDGNFSDYVLLLIPIFLGFVLATSIEVRDFIKIYGNIIYYLSFFSLIVYCVNIIFPFIIQKLPLIGNVYTYSAEIHNAFLAVAITNSENIRNYGLAWEPGAFSLLVCLALMFETIFYNRINYKRMIIFIITIITTFSTAGYFAMIGILYSNFFYKRKLSKNERNILLLIALVIGIFIFCAPDQIKQLVFSKLNGLFNGTTGEIAYTTQSRINAVKYPIQAFLSAPLIGVGYEKFNIINHTFCDNVATNTIINWYAIFGIFMGLMCCIGLFRSLCKFIRKIDVPIINVFILCLSISLLLSTESLLRISLVYVFVFWGFQKTNIAKVDLLE